MSQITIHFENLEQSVKKSEGVRDRISDYVDIIKKQIITPISGLSGSDSTGYTSTASSLAWGKINLLNDKATRYSNFETAVNNLISVAETKDQYVSDQIGAVADSYITDRAWWQNAGDWIYNTFCINIGNKWDGLREFNDSFKSWKNDVGNQMEPVIDWFKYGDGKYVLNIVKGVAGAVAAIAGAIAAVCATVGTAGAASPATIPLIISAVGAAASSIGAVITTVNSVTSVTQNIKALNIARENPSAARYYGSQNTLSEHINKTDLGNQETNEFMEGLGRNVDRLKTAADTTSFICNIASLGNISGHYAGKSELFSDTEWNLKYSLKYDNIKDNIMKGMGFNNIRKLDAGKAFNPFDNILATNYNVKKFTFTWAGGSWAPSQEMVYLFQGAKATQNILGINEKIGTINDFFEYRDTAPTWKDGKKAIEAVTGLMSNINYLSPIDKYAVKPIKNVSTFVEPRLNMYHAIFTGVDLEAEAAQRERQERALDYIFTQYGQPPTMQPMWYMNPNLATASTGS